MAYFTLGLIKGVPSVIISLLTDAANAMGRVLYRAINVRFIIEWVPFSAVGLSSIYARPTNTSQTIFPMGYWLKVIRPNARGISTEMIEGQAIWNGPNHQLVCKAIGEHWITPSKHKYAIAARILISSPKPAVISLVDFRPKPLLDGQSRPVPQVYGWVAPSAPPAHVMVRAPTPGQQGPIAIWNATLSLHRELTPSVATRPGVHPPRSLSLYQVGA